MRAMNYSAVSIPDEAIAYIERARYRRRGPLGRRRPPDEADRIVWNRLGSIESSSAPTGPRRGMPTSGP